MEWTDRARAYIDAKEYRYLSPVFSHTKTGEVTRILRAALTNTPALELTALARDMGANSNLIDPISELKRLLGLEDNADFNSIIEAVRYLKLDTCSSTASHEEFVPISKLHEAIALAEAVHKQAEQTAIESTVDKAIQEGNILPRHKDLALTLCGTDKGLFDQFVNSVSPFLVSLRGMQTGGISPEKRDCKSQINYLDETSLSICQAMGHTQEEFIQLGLRGK